MPTKRVTQVIIDLPASEPGENGKNAYSPRIGTSGNWETWNDSTGQYEDTGHSPIGASGAIAYPAGYWTNTITYTKTSDIAPYVQYGDLYYLLIKNGDCIGVNPQTDVTNNGGNWRLFDKYQAIYTDALVAAFAKIGGAVFTGDTTDISPTLRGKLISQMGIDGTSTYQDYTGDGGTWQPKILIDFINGLFKGDNVDIRGTIRGVGGYFEGMVRSPFKTHSADIEYFGDENGFHPISTPNNATSQNILVCPQPLSNTLNLPTSDFNGLKLTIINMSTVFGSSLDNYGKYIINAGTNKIINANYGYWMEPTDQWNDQPGTIDVVTGDSYPMVNTPVSSIEIDRGEMIELIGIEGLTSMAPNYITKGWIITNRRRVLPVQ